MIVQSIILGIVQGLTEFLPVSSSAHLNLFPWIFEWKEISEMQGMDIALHTGTLLALVLFFFKDWIKLIKAGYNQVVKKEKTTDGKIFWHLVIATIPAGLLSLILGKISDKIIENKLDIEMLIIGITLIIMGILLYFADKKAKSKTNYKNMSLKQSVLVGASQAIAAALPGVSRSGITMTVARALNIDRESSAKFSFMLAMPITFAAIIFDLNQMTFNIGVLLGILTSFIVGVLIIKFLLNYLKKGSFKFFAIYRVILGLIVIGIFCFR